MHGSVTILLIMKEKRIPLDQRQSLTLTIRTIQSKVTGLGQRKQGDSLDRNMISLLSTAFRINNPGKCSE